MSPVSLARFLRATAKQSPQRQTLVQEKKHLLLSLISIGFEKVGEGAFGMALVRSGLAVKIVRTSESVGYLAYARICRSGHYKNRLFPRVHAILSVGRYSCVIMERLHDKAKKSAALCPSLRRASRNRSYARQVGRLMGRSPQSSEQAFSKIERVIQASVRSYWDIRADNILFRKEGGKLRPVLADPIAF